MLGEGVGIGHTDLPGLQRFFDNIRHSILLDLPCCLTETVDTTAQGRGEYIAAVYSFLTCISLNSRWLAKQQEVIGTQQ